MNRLLVSSALLLIALPGTASGEIVLEDLDTPGDGQISFPIGAGIAFNYIPDISNLAWQYIPLPVNAEIMFLFNICTGSEIRHFGDTEIGDKRHGQIYRTQGSWSRSNSGLDF